MAYILYLIAFFSYLSASESSSSEEVRNHTKLPDYIVKVKAKPSSVLGSHEKLSFYFKVAVEAPFYIERKIVTPAVYNWDEDVTEIHICHDSDNEVD